MKKIVILSSVAVVALFADMFGGIAKDAALSQAKSEARSAAVSKVGGTNPLTNKLANTAADKVLGKEDPVEKMKSNAIGSLLGGKSATNATGAAALVGGVTGGSGSLKDSAVDMAAQKAEDTIGKETLEKETAKSLIKSAL